MCFFLVYFKRSYRAMKIKRISIYKQFIRHLWSRLVRTNCSSLCLSCNARPTLSPALFVLGFLVVRTEFFRYLCPSWILGAKGVFIEFIIWQHMILNDNLLSVSCKQIFKNSFKGNYRSGHVGHWRGTCLSWHVQDPDVYTQQPQSQKGKPGNYRQSLPEELLKLPLKD